MKHTLLYIALALASFTLQPATVQAKVLKDSKAKKEAKVQKTPKVVKQLVVLHTNDTHSCVMPYNPNLADTAIANRGGYLRRVAMIKQERSLNPDLLLFDSGDFSQGSPYYSLFKGDVEVGLMNEMKYDAATIGNHEFDYGMDNMVRLFKMAKFPIVCANYDFTGTELADIVKPYVILHRKGLKIGVFGLAPQLAGLVIEKNYGCIQYLDPIQKANEILSMGYNGLPMGCSDDEFPWAREGEDPLETKYVYTTHSELNAILNYNGGSLAGAKLYVSLFPCNECAKAIIQAGIKEVIYDCDKYADTAGVKASKRMMDAAGVRYHQYHRTGRKIEFEI